MNFETEHSLMPSVLDRLIDASRSQVERLWYDEAEMVASVERDLEDLLNARQTYIGLDKFPELRRSIIGFGLPDSANFDLEIPQSRLQFARTIETVIREFEPRVEDVRVQLIDSNKEQLRKLQFRIDAKLRVDSAPDVSFETTLQLTTGHYEVKQVST